MKVSSFQMENKSKNSIFTPKYRLFLCQQVSPKSRAKKKGFYPRVRVGGVSPGVTGAACEPPLEGVESNEVRTRGRPSPLYSKYATNASIQLIVIF